MDRSNLKLSDVARHLSIPDGIVASDFPKLAKRAAACGIHFDTWQAGIGTLILGKRKDGTYACSVGGAGMSIPRQAGKTYMVGMLTIFMCLMRPNMTVLWTAHRSKTSGETFKSMQGSVNRQQLRRYVETIRRANGQEAIEFTNGSRILFGAREQGFGRGFAEVDIEIFDEAQILTEKALDDMLPATSVSKIGIVIYMGTPPRPGVDPGEVFESKRIDALKFQDPDTLWVEFSAERGCDPDDQDQWLAANPSLPHRTPIASIARLRRQLGTDSFMREALGIWDENGARRAISDDVWQSGTVDERPDGGVPAFALDMPPDRSMLTIGACQKYEDGSAHIELVEYRPVAVEGTMWAVEWITERWPRAAAVVIDAQSPAMALVPELKARGVRVMQTGASDMGRACGRIVDMLNTKMLTHLPDEAQPQLAEAVRNLTTRPIGQGGAFGWNRTGGDIDISPMVACTLAVYGAFTTRRDPTRRARVAIT